jgi:hypothetical protein
VTLVIESLERDLNFFGQYSEHQTENGTAHEVSMLARPTLTRPAQEGANKPQPQARPTEERFLLKVDGQMKCSFSGKEDAASAGAKIKKAYPIVVVTVVDTEQHTTEIINS